MPLQSPPLPHLKVLECSIEIKKLSNIQISTYQSVEFSAIRFPPDYFSASNLRNEKNLLMRENYIHLNKNHKYIFWYESDSLE